MNLHIVPSIEVVPGPDGLNRRAFSADDVRRMTEAGILGEDDPFELVDGELIEMSAKGFAHERAKNAIARLISRRLDDVFYVAVESTLRLDERTLLEPDIMVCRQDAIRRSTEGYVEVAGRDILLLIEVADSSLRYDKVRKAGRYAAHGVAEYWIADLNASQMLVHREPGHDGYGEVRQAPATEAVRPLAPALAAVAIRLADLA